MNRPLLIYIGGSFPQLAGIRAALDVGLDVLLTDRSADAPGAVVAPHFERLDATDEAGFLALAERLESDPTVQPVGVYALEDYAAVTAARVAERLSLTHPPVDAVVRSVSKHLASIAWEQAGLPIPPTRVLSGDEVGEGPAYPLVVKPSRSWSSQGITRLDDPAGLELAIAHARRFSDHVLLQSHLAGNVINVDGLFVEDRFIVTGFFDRANHRDVAFHTGRIYLPAELSEAQRVSLAACVEGAARAIGIDAGPITADLIIVDERHYLLELSTHLHSVHQTALRDGSCRPLQAWFAYLGGDDGWRRYLDGPPPTSHSGMHVIPPVQRATVRPESVEAVRGLPGIRDIDIRYRPGGSGVIWGVAESREALVALFDRAAELIEFEPARDECEA